MVRLTTRLFCVAAVAMGIASAASSYKLKVYAPVAAGTAELAAGTYQVEVQGDKAIFTQGKKSFEVPVTVEKGDKKFSSTTYTAIGSKIKEIDLGGTNDKIIFAVPSATSSGTK